MSSTSVHACLDGRVVAADLDKAINLLVSADRARAEAAELLGHLDGSGLAEWLGYVSLDRLIAHRSGCGNPAAVDVMRVAKHLDRFDVTANAVRSGRVSFSAARVLAQAASGLATAYAEYEETLVAAAASRELEDLERVCRLWRDRADTAAAAKDAEHRFNQRGVWLQFAFDGSCHGRLALDADGAEIVAQALESKPDPVSAYGEARSVAQRRADTLVELCQGNSPGNTEAGRSGVSIDVAIDIETLAGSNSPIDLEQARAELAHGGPITGPGLDRLLCDASFRALITDGPRTVLAYNRATPAIPPGLRRAVHIRDRRCTFHGCDRPPHWCDIHHIIPRNRGGPTTAENLTLLCRYHHTLTHEGGWQLNRAPNGEIVASRP